MKKLTRLTALILVAAMLALVLSACGTMLSGTYTTGEALGSGVTYTFKGNKVKITTKVLTFEKSFEGKYAIDGDEITFTFEDSEADDYDGTVSFEKGADYIKIGGITLTKEK